MFVTGKEKGLLMIYNEHMPRKALYFHYKKEDFTDEMRERVFKFNDFVNEIAEKLK